MEVAGGAMSHFFINSIKDRPGLAEIGINASARSKLGRPEDSLIRFTSPAGLHYSDLNWEK